MKKGEMGEAIMRQYLESKGWVVYFPFTKDRAHYFDMLATLNKEKVIAVDVKTKARFNKWDAQGIDKRSYAQYVAFVNSTNVQFFLVFIDDKTGDVHAANIMQLKREFYPTRYLIAWPIEQMKFLFNIGEENIRMLSEFDQRAYEFQPVTNH